MEQHVGPTGTSLETAARPCNLNIIRDYQTQLTDGAVRLFSFHLTPARYDRTINLSELNTMNEGESNLLGWLTFVATLIAAAVAWRNHSSQQKQKREKRALELIEKFRETKPDRDKVFEDI